jgi:hypothetical protein
MAAFRERRSRVRQPVGVVWSAQERNSIMKSAFVMAAALGLAFTPPLSSGPAEAKGCLKGALVGGVAGHMAHHGVLGAVGGCAVGHHMANEKAKEPAESAAQNPHPPASPPAAQ